MSKEQFLLSPLGKYKDSYALHSYAYDLYAHFVVHLATPLSHFCKSIVIYFTTMYIWTQWQVANFKLEDDWSLRCYISLCSQWILLHLSDSISALEAQETQDLPRLNVWHEKEEAYHLCGKLLYYFWCADCPLFVKKRKKKKYLLKNIV